MSETKSKPGFCWCNMCGYTAAVRPDDREKVSDDAQARCPDCETLKQMSFLCSDDELPDYVIPDDPMKEWPSSDYAPYIPGEPLDTSWLE